MELPPALENQFKEEILQLEKQKNMPYVTNIERMGKEEGIQIGLEKGRQEGLREGLEQGQQVGLEQGRQAGIEEGVRRASQEMIEDTLLLRFGEVPSSILAKLDSVSDLTILKQYHRLALTCPNLDEILRQLERE